MSCSGVCIKRRILKQAVGQAPLQFPDLAQRRGYSKPSCSRRERRRDSELARIIFHSPRVFLKPVGTMQFHFFMAGFHVGTVGALHTIVGFCAAGSLSELRGTIL